MSRMDLTNRRFGRLTVIEEAEPAYTAGKPFRRWRCRCDCGNEVVVRQAQLTTGKTKSCGCLQRDMASATHIDLTGQRFGRLVVLGPVRLDQPQRNGNRLGWRCRCDCGNEIVSDYKSLVLTGTPRSCGCLLQETARDKIERLNTVGHYAGTTVSAIRPERQKNKNNRTGVKGVCWKTREQRYVAKIGVQGKTITLGRYRNLADAAQARAEAEKKYFAPIIDEYDALRAEEEKEE